MLKPKLKPTTEKIADEKPSLSELLEAIQKQKKVLKKREMIQQDEFKQQSKKFHAKILLHMDTLRELDQKLNKPL